MPELSACVKCTADVLRLPWRAAPWSETGAWYILKQAHMRWLSIGVHWMRGAARAYAVRVCGGGGGGMWGGGWEGACGHGMCKMGVQWCGVF
jgi:hypothetical protein